MSDTHAPVLVRMENDLKAALQRAAKAHGRTLTGEINKRLSNSLLQADSDADVVITAAKVDATGKPLPESYTTVVQAKSWPANESDPANTLSDADRAVLAVFRAMPVEKQLALISLFK